MKDFAYCPFCEGWYTEDEFDHETDLCPDCGHGLDFGATADYDTLQEKYL